MPMPESSGNPGPDPEVGMLLGGCTILERIGQGGMGIVYKAEQVRLRRIVALKVPLPRLVYEDPTYYERFLREARAAAQLNHQNVVHVYDADEEDGRYYIIMEFVHGESLKQRIHREGRLPPARALPVIHQAAEGLQAAHEIGLIHRDIKPSNFLITTQEVVKLADFGLAKAVSSVTMTTVSGVVPGTIHYMSPEQCRGEKLGPRSDIYSLGVTLFEMLTGRRPFDSDSTAAVLYMHVHEPIPGDLRADATIPPALADVVYRAMAKRPEERFPNVPEFLAALRPLMREIPAAARPPKPPPEDPMAIRIAIAKEKAQRQWVEAQRSRRRRAMALAAVIALGVGTAGVALLIGSGRRTPNGEPVVPPAAPGLRDYGSYLREGQSLAQAEKWAEAQQAFLSAREVADKLDPRPADYSELLSRMTECGLHMAEAFFRARKWPEARDALQKAKKLGEEVEPRPPSYPNVLGLLAESDFRIGQSLTKEGKWLDAWAALHNAKAVAAALPSPPAWHSGLLGLLAECEQHVVPDWAKVAKEQIEGARKEGVLPAIEVSLGQGQTIRLVYIPPGEFVMGASEGDRERLVNELPAHRVRITKGFHMGVYEITVGQWRAVMGVDPSHFRKEDGPVELVSWQDCQEFVQRLNEMHRAQWEFRLPTEAEWEYACRAGTTTRFPWGHDFVGIGQRVNLADATLKFIHQELKLCAVGENDGFAYTSPVGKYPPNPWGLYDVLGNVGEWCLDYYSDVSYASSPPEDPKGPTYGETRVIRGGDWFHDPWECRSSGRTGRAAAFRGDWLGLRLVCRKAR